MKRHEALSVFVAALMWVAAAAEPPRAGADERHDSASWVVVVPPSNPVRVLKRSELDRIYRRTTRYWNTSEAAQPALPILPINLPPGNVLRNDFARNVLRADDESLATFWNREYFQGVLPPLVLQSPAAVRAYVAATPGAIGYLPAALVDPSVAVVRVEEGD
ncbi:MAG: hypothetical protein HY899_02200 [Deltaproteobacteria bacterium]|nr:hypothetical protein [Deltaproteobacteria bacterium]